MFEWVTEEERCSKREEEKKMMLEFYLSGDFYPVDFINHANKSRDDFQYLNNQLNITDWSLFAKIGLKEIKIRSPDKLILGYVNVNSTEQVWFSSIYARQKRRHVSYFWNEAGWFSPYGPI